MEKRKIAVFGAGRWGPNLIRNFHTNGRSTVVAVVDQDQKRLDLIKSRYPEIKTFLSVSDLLENSDFDTAAVCTPTDTHYELTKELLENDKHVFVEKPLATKVEHCQELVEIARKKQRTLFVGHVFVYNAGIQAVKKYIDDNSLGKILYFHINRTNLGPVRTDVNALWDLAPHDLSILQYWLGEAPSSVTAMGACFLNAPIEDAVFATYRFKNNIFANVHVSWLNPKKVREIVVVGENKMLIWDDMNISNPVHIYDKKIEYKSEDLADTFLGFRNSIHEGDTLIPKIKLNEPLAAECEAFLDAIENPNQSLSSGEHGTGVVAALTATQTSMKEHSTEIPIQC